MGSNNGDTNIDTDGFKSILRRQLAEARQREALAKKNEHKAYGELSEAIFQRMILETLAERNGMEKDKDNGDG